jgi:hypothetical protein
MTRVALTTLLVSATLPFAAALAQTAAEPDGTPSAPVEVILSGSPAAAPPEAITMPAEPVETAPAPPPATAPVLTSIVTAPTPVEIAPAGPSATAAAPSAPPATPAAEPRVPAKPPKPRAATVVTVVSGRAIPATTITVRAEAKPVSHAGPLAPNAKATLKLPKMKGCLVTVAATFEEGSVSDGAAVDVCKVKLVRLTD